MIAIDDNRIETILEIISRKTFTAEEQRAVEEFQEYFTERKQYFSISTVHRDDLEAVGIHSAKVDDGDMETLARKMADDYQTQLYWSSMEIIAKEGLNMPLLADRVQLYTVEGTVTDCDLSDYPTLEEIAGLVGGSPMIFASDEESKRFFITARDAPQEVSNINIEATSIVVACNQPFPVHGAMLVCPHDKLEYLREALKFYVGQKVWWDDPDEGQSSGDYNVFEVTDEYVSITNGYSEADVPFHELKIK